MILIKNGTLVRPECMKTEQKSIVIENGKIKEIGEGYEDADFEQVIDAKGMMVAPGLIDVHVHYRDPGFTYKEDVITGANAAKKGGFTTIITMANTKPAVDNVETLAYLLEKGKETGIHVIPAAAISKDLKGKELVKMEELKAHGAIGFTDDGMSLMDEKLVVEAMKEAKRLQVPLSFHEEDPYFIENSGVNKGAVSEKLGLGGASAIAEDILVARDGMLAFETGCTINIQHISSRHSVALVKLYKEMGASVFAEAAPHHFSLDETAVLEHGTLAKMNPPLRTKEDQQAIIEGLKDGTIDIIATDHAPHSKEEKEKPFTEAPSGIIGLETSLALGITNLVKKGHLTIEELIAKMTLNPAKLYRLDYGTLEPGKCADVVIFNPDEQWTVDSFVSKASNSPFLGATLTGKVHYTICKGDVVYQN
ncbi:dihydroorotase [[Clostridium] polysaccharolyticum]|uniref:Dihydroorotase n=1 Tax=[Clostridium] polysaccharolyticum TaxID=29364 RepID=A0A1I0FK48_9FIRM|nr:dihydroorotase [[Clostridium] polysaccharolyticum]SET58730.1 dihydroorotase [[Clostridium] polysaccharolyticum]